MLRCMAGSLNPFSRLLVGAFALAALFAPAAEKRVTAREAKDHVGETATVCGTVVSARHATQSKGEPPFPDLDEPFPQQIFTIVIAVVTAQSSGNRSAASVPPPCICPCHSLCSKAADRSVAGSYQPSAEDKAASLCRFVRTPSQAEKCPCTR